MFPETYSQYDEEQAILVYIETHVKRFGETHYGRFLDIGAWDPKVFSNTRALFERGWGGVLIEPSPNAMLGLLKEYGNEPRVTIVQAAMAVEALPLKMWMTADAVSTADPASHEKNKGAGGYFGQATVMAITWAEVNNWYGGFQFVSIDAEGLSVDLFHSMIASGQRPECVCVEFDQRFAELCAAATKVGYKLLYSNGTNGVLGR